MKTRILVLTVVCAIAGLLGWYLNPPAAQPAAKPDAPALNKVEAPKSAPTAIAPPIRSAQVAAPVAAAAMAQPTPATQPDAETFVAEPQADLKMCVSTTLHFLETQDIASLVKTIMPPDAINQMIQSGQANSVEDIAEHYRQMPDVAVKMNQLLWSLQNAQNEEPEMSADGTRATYKLDQQITKLGTAPAPAGTPGNITFMKVNGFWYMR